MSDFAVFECTAVLPKENGDVNERGKAKLDQETLETSESVMCGIFLPTPITMAAVMV